MGSQDTVPAVEMAVRFMHAGERAVVWSHSKFAYGLGGRLYYRSNNSRDDNEYELPSESNVAFEITILRRVDSMDQLGSILNLAKARKEQANEMYQAEWSKGAGKIRIKQSYERIVREMEGLLEQANDLPKEAIETVQALRIDALNNITAVLLRAKDYKAAKTAATAVLMLDPNNFKALIRAAKAALLDPSSEFVEVEKALEAAASCADNDSVREDVAKLKQEFERRKLAYEQSSKQMFQKAFHDKKGKDKKTNQTTRPLSKPAHDSSTDVTDASADREQVQESSSDWQRLLRNYILPYGFQIMLMIVMLVFLQRNLTRRETSGTDSNTMSKASSEDEF